MKPGSFFGQFLLFEDEFVAFEDNLISLYEKQAWFSPYSLLFYATFLFRFRLLWYLYRLKPQEIKVNSKRTALSPRRNSLLYDRSHFITPNVPSACMLLFIHSNAPWIDSGLLITSWTFPCHILHNKYSCYRIHIRHQQQDTLDNARMLPWIFPLMEQNIPCGMHNVWHQ